MKAKKILKIIGIVVCLISIVGGITIYLKFDLYKDLLQSTNRADAILNAIFQRRIVADDYLLYGSERAKEQWYIKQLEIKELVSKEHDAYRDSKNNRVDIFIIEKMKTLVDDSEKIFASMVEVQSMEAESSNKEKLENLRAILTTKAQETIALGNELRTRLAQSTDASLNELVAYFLAIIALYLLLLAISFIVIFRNVDLLQRVNEMKSDFVSLVSHQLKTPVAQVKGYVENMIDGLTGPINDKQKEYLTDMLSVANKNSKLIDDLLNISRIERGMLKVNIESLPFAELVNDVLSPLRNVAKAKGVNLVEEVSQTNVSVVGDSVKTREALRNIVDNAIKFTDPGKSVTVQTTEEGDFVKVSVADQGTGIDPDVQNELFEKNRVWSGKVKASGAGLGLFLSKQFIELTHGIITFTTAAGKGTTFVIKLKKVV